MQLNRCPICHSRISLEAMVQDDAGRELLNLLVKLDSSHARALVSYLGLFRSSTRDLSNDKAIRLANDVLELCQPYDFKVSALLKTVESLQGKGGKPLANHNYLKRVLEDTTNKNKAVGWVERSETHAVNKDGFRDALPILPARNLSKTAQALQSLEDFGNE